jgi:hypothetical protein
MELPKFVLGDDNTDFPDDIFYYSFRLSPIYYQPKDDEVNLWKKTKIWMKPN